MVTPHLAYPALALSNIEHKVTYVAEQTISPESVEQGWILPELTGRRVVYMVSLNSISELFDSAFPDSIHIFQEVSRNVKVSFVQNQLQDTGLRQWVIIQTIDYGGLIGLIKRLKYQMIFRTQSKLLWGVLAIGH